MDKVIFDYSLRLNVIKQDREKYDIANLDEDGLKSLMMGRIFIFFEAQREYIILKTGLIDYLIQLREVIFYNIERGNHQTFSVSCDWYSNSLSYIFHEQSGKLTIREVNDAKFEITTNYKKFKIAFEKFYKSTLEELKVHYPGLAENKNFIEMMYS